MVQAGRPAHANPPRTPLPIHVLRTYGCCAPSTFPSSRICRKNMFRVQGQGLRVWPTGCAFLITKNARITGLDLLGVLARPGGEGLPKVAKLAATLSKQAAGRVQHGCFAGGFQRGAEADKAELPSLASPQIWDARGPEVCCDFTNLPTPLKAQKLVTRQ